MGPTALRLNPHVPASLTLRRQRDEPREAAGHRRLRDGRVGPRGELAQRERRVAQAKLGRVLERRSEVGEHAGVPELPSAFSCACAERLWRTRFAWSAFATRFASARKPGDDRTFLEGENGLRRAGDGEECLDRIPALRVCRRVTLSVEDTHPDARGRGDAAHERGTGVERRAHLEVRPPRPAASRRRGMRRAGMRSDSTAARRRGPAGGRAAARHGPTRRPGRGSSIACGDPATSSWCGPPGRTRGGGRCGSRRGRGAPAGSRTPAARLAARRGRGGTRARPCRGDAPFPRCGTEPESSASRSHRRVGTTAASSARASAARAPALTGRPLERQQPPLEAEPARAVPSELVGSPRPAATMRWHGTTSDRRFAAQKLPAARAARGLPASAARPPYVTTSPHGDRASRPEQRALEWRELGVVERDVVVRDRRPAEVGREPPAQIRHEAVTHLCRSRR